MLPDDGPLWSGTTYKPFNADTTGDTFPNAPEVFSEPAPAAAATFTSVFGGLTATQATGTWSLFVTDDLLNNDSDWGFGTIASGWSLDITFANQRFDQHHLPVRDSTDRQFQVLHQCRGSRVRANSGGAFEAWFGS